MAHFVKKNGEIIIPLPKREKLSLIGYIDSMRTYRNHLTMSTRIEVKVVINVTDENDENDEINQLQQIINPGSPVKITPL